MNVCMIGRFKRFEDLYQSQSLEKYFGLIHNYKYIYTFSHLKRSFFIIIYNGKSMCFTNR